MRRTPILIVIILIFLATSLCLWYEFGAFQPYNRWTALRDINEGHLQIIEIGEPALDPIGRASRARSFGFEIHSYGCDLFPWARHGIHDYNRIMREYLESKNGKEIFKEVEDSKTVVTDLPAPSLRMDKVEELVESQPLVKARTHYVDSASGGRRHLALMTDIMDSVRNIYRVRVVEDNGVNYSVHFTYTIDATTMQVLSDHPDESTP